jgi:hypothetical protein
MELVHFVVFVPFCSNLSRFLGLCWHSGVVEGPRGTCSCSAHDSPAAESCYGIHRLFVDRQCTLRDANGCSGKAFFSLLDSR